jgi:hypothetical protein
MNLRLILLALLVALALAGLGFLVAALTPGAKGACKSPHCASTGTGTTATTAASSSGPCGTAASPPASWAHVVWIVFENHSYSQIIGARSARYFNQLAGQCGLATNYHAVSYPSLPNYIAMTSGDTWGIADDNAPASHPLTVASIYSQLKSAGKSWRDYEESAPSNCPQVSSGTYAVKHDPAPYYTTIAADCALWDVPMGTTSSGSFLTDLQNGTLPDFSFVTPNLCDDMHDCSIRAGDNWLKSRMPLILGSSAYQAGQTAVFVTFDEDGGGAGNHVVTIVVSPSTPSGATSATGFSHYSLLRTTEEMLDLPLLAHAGDSGTAGMRSAFDLG